MTAHDKNNTFLERLADYERRVSDLTTATNTASSQISGGRTVVDQDGSVQFIDGGAFIVANSSAIKASSGSTILDSSGDLVVDSVTVLGDVFSTQDYMLQRESLVRTIVDTPELTRGSWSISVDLPDWASSALISLRVSGRGILYAAAAAGAEVTVNINSVPYHKSTQIPGGYVNFDVNLTKIVDSNTDNINISIDTSDRVSPAIDAFTKISYGVLYTP